MGLVYVLIPVASRRHSRSSSDLEGLCTHAFAPALSHVRPYSDSREPSSVDMAACAETGGAVVGSGDRRDCDWDRNRNEDGAAGDNGQI